MKTGKVVGKKREIMRNVSPIPAFLSALGVFASGVLFLFNPRLALNLLDKFGAIAIISIGVLNTLGALGDKSGKLLIKLALGLALVAVGLFFMINAHTLLRWVDKAFGIWCCFSGVMMMVNAIKLKVDQAEGVLNYAMLALAYYLFGAALFSTNLLGERFFTIAFGIYLVFYAGNLLTDTYIQFMDTSFANKKVKTRTRVAVPTIIAAFIPSKALKSINKTLETEPDAIMIKDWTQADKTVDVEIFVHTKIGFIEGMGHCDLCVGNDVYSYGNYDPSTWKIGGFIASGVLARSTKEGYIRHCLEFENKTLISYGLSLTPEQQEAVNAHIHKLTDGLPEWKCKYQQWLDGGLQGKAEDFTDAPSELCKAASASFQKFNKGSPFRTYYALGTNCVVLCDTIVGQSGIDILKVNGIVTPGTYLAYLDGLYERGDTIVVSKTIYKENETKPNLFKTIQGKFDANFPGRK